MVIVSDGTLTIAASGLSFPGYLGWWVCTSIGPGEDVYGELSVSESPLLGYSS